MKYLILFLFLLGCSPSSLKDFQKEGEAQMRKLNADLEAVQSREDLHKAFPKLKKRFNYLADLMIEARRYKENNPLESPPEPSESNYYINEGLVFELKRIYRLEGGRETIEKAQREALIKLDAFEKKLLKERQALGH